MTGTSSTSPPCDRSGTLQTGSRMASAGTINNPLSCDWTVTRRIDTGTIRTQPFHTGPWCDPAITPQSDTDTATTKPVRICPPCDRIITRQADRQPDRHNPPLSVCHVISQSHRKRIAGAVLTGTSSTSPPCDRSGTLQADRRPTGGATRRHPAAMRYTSHTADRYQDAESPAHRYRHTVRPVNHTAGRFTTTPAANHPPIIHLSPQPSTHRPLGTAHGQPQLECRARHHAGG